MTLLRRQEQQVRGFALAAGGTDDLPSIVDREGVEQNPTGSLRLQYIEIDHLTVPPQESVPLSAPKIRCPNHLATVIDPRCFTWGVAQGAQILHGAAGI